jgi:membrane-bound ClpP family serine protease
MTPASLAILLFASGLVLLLAEVFLPSHGILGVVGLVALFAGVGTCFWINKHLGLASAIGLVILMPFAVALAIKVWPHTYAGKRLILGKTAAAAAHAPAAPVAVGQMGIVVSELRPGGVCEFGMARVESRCESGTTIPAGRHVEVVAVVDRRPLVRAV